MRPTDRPVARVIGAVVPLLAWSPIVAAQSPDSGHRAEATLRGHAVDTAGTALAEVEVLVIRERDSVTVAMGTSNARGDVVMTGVASDGRYLVVARKIGYQAVEKTGVELPDGETKMRFELRPLLVTLPDLATTARRRGFLSVTTTDDSLNLRIWHFDFGAKFNTPVFALLLRPKQFFRKLFAPDPPRPPRSEIDSLLWMARKAPACGSPKAKAGDTCRKKIKNPTRGTLDSVFQALRHENQENPAPSAAESTVTADLGDRGPPLNDSLPFPSDSNPLPSLDLDR